MEKAAPLLFQANDVVDAQTTRNNAIKRIWINLVISVLFPVVLKECLILAMNIEWLLSDGTNYALFLQLSLGCGSLLLLPIAHHRLYPRVLQLPVVSCLCQLQLNGSSGKRVQYLEIDMNQVEWSPNRQTPHQKKHCHTNL